MATELVNLYVTYVDVDGELLKIWGQKNRIGATYIERQLMQMLPDFNRTAGPDPSQIHRGMFCFAKDTDDNYYRARVISDVQGDSVGVLFVDYGNRDFIKISNIRLQQGNEDVLTKMSEQAEEYYLARVMAPQFGWTKEIVKRIRHDIGYDEFRSRVVAHLANQKIVEIEFRNEDFSNYLIKNQIARSLPLAEQKHMIFSYGNLVSKSEASSEKISFSPSIPPPNMRTLKPHNSTIEENLLHYNRPNLSGNFSKPTPFNFPPSRYVNPLYQQTDKNPSNNPFYSQGTPLTNPMPMNIMPVMNPLLNNHSMNQMYQMKSDVTQFNDVIEILAQQVKQYIAQDNTKSETEEEKEPHHFVNSVLEVGNSYNVFVSHIDDGPWSFSVQLVSSEGELKKLMEDLSLTNLVPLKPPIILGHPCIASSKLYGNLCRGVVVSISHSSVKVYFVDFGNAEDLPSSSIYELPNKFFKVLVMSQKFSLSGLDKVTYSDDIKKFFKEVVQDELLMLRVTTLTGDNLPTCELYVKDKNIKRILNEKIREMRSLQKDDFPKAGDTENVVVTWIISPQKFFVQLRKRDPELNELKKELEGVEKRGQKIPSHQLAVGLRCVCQYEADGQWYRTVITNIDSENEISVFYIDYGNTERVNVSSLRKIDGSCLINQLNPQAIQCCLKGFEKKMVDQKMNSKLEELTLEKDLKMKVVSSEKELLCVQLFYNGNDVSLPLATETSKSSSRVIPAPRHENEWNLPVNNQMSQWDNRQFKIDRSEGRSFQLDRNRKKFDGRKNADLRSYYQQGYRRMDDRGARGGRPFSISFRNDKENEWNNPRVVRCIQDGNMWSRVFRQGNRGYWDNTKKTEYYKDRKMLFDGDRGSRRFDENKRPEMDGMRKFERRQNGRETSFFSNESKKFGQPRSTRKCIRQEDIAPPGSRFEQMKINIGSTEKGIVTYYFNPDDFYIQLLTQEDEFKKMMKDIQVYYSDKYSLRNPVQAGDIVIAMFSLDKILYRAEVIRPTPVTVRYVDYGNRELVPPKGYWAVDKQFLKLPQQVIKCRLSNIQPNDFDWSPPGGEVDKFFGREEYTCTFVGFEDGVYEIILKAIGSQTDVATEIIAAGLAQPKTVVATIDVPEINYDLLPKQILRLYITHVVSTSKFYVLIDPQKAAIVDCEIKDQKVLASLEKTSLKPGTKCLTTSDDGSWCRGIITGVNGDTVSIWFMDRGDDVEVTAIKVKKLPNHIAEIEPQAVECRLDGVTMLENDEEFKKTVEHKHQLVSIVSVDNNRLSVVLYDEEGQKSKFQKDTKYAEAIQPIGDLPILNQRLPLTVTHVKSSNEVYVQRLSDKDDLNKLTSQLSEFYAEEKGGLDNEELGQLIAAKSVKWETWRRGRILSSMNDEFEIFYVDYGDEEVLPRDNVKKLDASFLTFPRYAKKMNLYVEESMEDVTEKISEITKDQELSGYFVNKEGKFFCELFLNEESISDLLKTETFELKSDDKMSFPLAKSFEEIPSMCQEEVKEHEESGTRVFISHIDGPKQFWAHKESTMSQLQQLQDKLQKISECLPGVESPEIDDLVAAKFSGAWYRVKVVAVDGSKVTVQFIDYGNTIVVDTRDGALKQLTPELRDPDVFATCYALQGSWSDEVTPRFEEIILSSEDPVTVVASEDGDPSVVDLFQNGKSVCEKLFEKACVEERNDLIPVYVTHSNSPKDFYVQRETSTEVLCNLAERLSEAHSFKTPSEVRENEIYVAKFIDDGVWYRVRVIEKYQDEYKVHFIDYGNTCNASEIRELPGDLMDIPNLAEHCSLIHGETFDGWSEAACEKFAEYTDGRECQMKIITSKPNKSIVMLMCEGKNVTEELGKWCEDDCRSEVYISHVVSPAEFYLQNINDEEYLTVASMLEQADEFEDLEDRQPDTLCVGRFPDDECWYRAKILKSHPDGYEVFFIDFGNISVSNELKKIPPELKDIPPKALKCSFPLLGTNIPESVKEEFMKLSLDSSSTFRARVITPGEVNIVSLKLNGRIIEESLWDDYVAIGEDQMPPSIEGTDDSKKSKLQNEYLNVEDDARASGSITNETDEEKRVKIGITVGDEGFKCDDEKGSEALSGMVNATDSELMEVSQNGDEEFSEIAEETSEIFETVEEIPKITKPTENVEKTEIKTENQSKFVRNTAQKIVPGCISRGEEEAPINGSSETPWKKLKYSEKVVPGSISRGISLESMANYEEPVRDTLPRQVSQSAPTTPKMSRRQDANAYVKTDRNDRLVPGCISAGIPLEASITVDKIPTSEKIVPGAVNGSVLDE